MQEEVCLDAAGEPVNETLVAFLGGLGFRVPLRVPIKDRFRVPLRVPIKDRFRVPLGSRV